MIRRRLLYTVLSTQRSSVCRRCYSVTSSTSYDVGIVGGGIVGVATARELLIRNPLLKVAIFEKEPKLGKTTFKIMK